MSTSVLQLPFINGIAAASLRLPLTCKRIVSPVHDYNLAQCGWSSLQISRFNIEIGKMG